MPRRLAALLLALAAAIPLAIVGGTTPAAQAADGLAFRNTTTYTVDATAGVVHVLAEVSLTNTIPDKRDGDYINRRFFKGFSLPIPVAAVNPVATTTNGRTLDVTGRLIDGNVNFYVLDVGLAQNLFYQQSTQVNVTYDITGLPPRSENPWRVNAAYAAFDAFGVGDDGKVTVRVVVPPGFEVDTFGDDAVVTTEDGNTVYTATDIPNPNEFDIFISARNDAGLAATTVTTPADDRFNLRAWPGDVEWQAFVTTQIEDGVPVLSTLIGQAWPIDETVEVREAYTPYLYGYAGWFSATDNEIEIGEDLDQEVVLHELSHAWFNRNWFADRWLNEGFAQVYSNKAVTQMGGEALTPDAISTTDPGKVTLNDWGDPNFTDGADDVEGYGYNASFSVVEQVVGEIGDDKMRAVLAAVADRTIAYRGEAEPEAYGRATDWRHFLDLVDEIGGAQKADELMAEYVVTSTQAALLDDRTAAREAYQQLIDDGGAWAPPYLVRDKMSAWSFTAAQTAMDDAQDVLTLRDQLDRKSDELGTTYPDDLERAYEAVDKNFVDATKAVQEQIDTADQVLAAVAAEAAKDGLLDKVGLIGTDLPALLDEAKAALSEGDHDLARAKAQEVMDTVDKAPDIGRTRSLWVGGGVALFLLLAVGLVVLLRRRGRRRRASRAAALAEQSEAVVTGAEDLIGVDAEPVEAVGEEGLWGDIGSDVPVEEISEIDLPEDTTADPTPDSEG